MKEAYLVVWHKGDEKLIPSRLLIDPAPFGSVVPVEHILGLAMASEQMSPDQVDEHMETAEIIHIDVFPPHLLH